MIDSFGVQGVLDDAHIVDLVAFAKRFARIDRLPLSHRIILENLLRYEDGGSVTATLIEQIARRNDAAGAVEIALHPSRVVMQDYAGLPVLLDLAALRDLARKRGGEPAVINSAVPSALVIDHSIIAHKTGHIDAQAHNLAREFADNEERFTFLKWAQQAFDGVQIVPPGKGIIHQVHIEYLAEVVSSRQHNDRAWLFPDTVIGTDSHTPMVSGIGALGWGVGGIEAEAVMLGEPLSMLLPPVIGVQLTGELPAGVLATDLALSLTEKLRRHGVVGSMLEFYGPGVTTLPVADRTTIANMTPEFGATASYFPVDGRTIDYMRLTGRTECTLAMIERYLKRNRLWFDPDFVPVVADRIEFRLNSVNRSVSGPSRPEQRHNLSDVSKAAQIAPDSRAANASSIANGDIVLAAIASCTNTSNPTAMMATGLLARRARELGLTVPCHVKTSFSPGSQIVVDYLSAAGCLADLEALGFGVTGFGCMTCVGNSGNLLPDVEAAVEVNPMLHLAAVLSGNRNFEGRIHAKVRSNFLASPPLVLAYALAGTILTDLTIEPVGRNQDGRPIMLEDLWPDGEDVDRALKAAMHPGQFSKRYGRIAEGDAHWNALAVPASSTFDWKDGSSFLRRPPFFDLPTLFPANAPLLHDAAPLLILGDMITTDHISPVGPISQLSSAGQYLLGCGVRPSEFNTYGARRGEHDVMLRGTFASSRLQNGLVDRAGGYTRLSPEGDLMTIYEASRSYLERGHSFIVVAGQTYGAGSARDWAAKGTRLLGVKAVLAESFERIHRSNLVRMGILPLQFAAGEGRSALGIGARSRLSIDATIDDLRPNGTLTLRLNNDKEQMRYVEATARVETSAELEYLKSGGILPFVAKSVLWDKEYSVRKQDYENSTVE